MVHSLLSGSPCKERSFLPPHYVGLKGDMGEREEGRRDGGIECWRDRELWMVGGTAGGMKK